jgi:AcrR family transcriptional regulator
MRRTKEDAALTRESLLKAGLAVFSRKGFNAATLADVAKEAGVTRGAIYWHFGSKVELFAALLNEYAARGGGIVQAAAAEGGRLDEVLRRVFTRLLQAVASDPDLRAVMELSLFKTERTPELAAALDPQRQASRGLREGIAAVMRSGIQSGVLRAGLDPDDLALAFLAANNGAIHLWLSDPESFSLGERAAGLAEIFMRGILAAP